MEPEIIGQKTKQNKGGFSWGWLIAIVLIIAVLAAIAIPNFLKYTHKSPQSEAKSNLAAIHTAQTSYFSDHGAYGKTFEEINWAPEGNNRYTYIIGGEYIFSLAGYNCKPETFPSTNGGFVAVAIGNIDKDVALDIWAINDDKVIANVCNDE